MATSATSAPTSFASGLHLPECPRWHEGSLWLSDMWDHTVARYALDGTRQVVHRFRDDEEPGGLGWLPDGTLLVAGMLGRVVYKVVDGEATVHADLSELAPHEVNDMVVADDGTAFVSQFGYPFARGPGGSVPTTTLIRVSTTGAVGSAADGLMVPNGVAIAADGRTMVVAESGAGRLSFYDVHDGVLRNRTEVAVPIPGDIPFATPDGICLDATGGVWVADPLNHRVVHLQDGAIDDEVAFEKHPLACVLGGDDRRTLFVCLSEVWSKADRRDEPTGEVMAFRTSTPGAGRP
jgi:sugar lactone lactonase YvrE